MWKRSVWLAVLIVALAMGGAIVHADNQLRNWEFDEPLGDDNWWLWETQDFDSVAPEADTTMSGDMSLRVVIPDGAGGSLQLIQSYLELVEGETYYISFMARADAPRVIAMMLLGRETNNWATFWYLGGIELTPDVQTFTFEYTHAGPTVGGTGNFNDDIDLNIDRVWLDTAPPPLATVPVLARRPDPQHMATDVRADVVLGWTPGEYAATHDVYFGTTYDDVNNADASDMTGVLVGRGSGREHVRPSRCSTVWPDLLLARRRSQRGAGLHGLRGQRLELHRRAGTVSDSGHRGHRVASHGDGIGRA